ncbi:regulatory protein, FmdB family [Anaeromyxobacter sp. K]|uniref:FmdB family zinc ribbon protein n=1 Tax=Anaeromyxobacter sp. (strain K) TaxID=447217 RepID=UPI00015F83E2|nr:zinc ribbon domain-containing protein [Anaeromyxobacter sp. K]ACG73530.1 regulatory protein, FmdB family [Anaeromyxobacter sp. K]
MPIYEFVCEACGRITEVMQKMSDPAPAACPECGAGKLARLVSRTTFQLKGGGWYSDLYASAKSKPAPAGQAAPGADGGAAPAAAPAKAAPSAAPAAPAAPGAGKGGATS